MRKFAVLEKQGKLPKGTLHKWAEETKKPLPEKAKLAKTMTKKK